MSLLWHVNGGASSSCIATGPSLNEPRTDRGGYFTVDARTP